MIAAPLLLLAVFVVLERKARRREAAEADANPEPDEKVDEGG